jgi:MFS family permease
MPGSRVLIFARIAAVTTTSLYRFGALETSGRNNARNRNYRSARQLGEDKIWPDPNLALPPNTARCALEYISSSDNFWERCAMATQPISDIHAEPEPQASWLPMVIIALAQILMIFNVSSLQVSIEGIVSSFNAPATTVGTAIVTYSLVVAGFIMLGARIGQIFGSRRVFRAMVALFGAAMALMAFSRGPVTMIIAQVMAGAAAATLVPTLVVLIADNYRGKQQEKALGWLGGAQAMGIVLAFLIAGVLSTWVGWRYTFGFLVILAAAIYMLSDKLSPIKNRTIVSIDKVGVVLAVLVVFFISIGANNLTRWGLLLAGPVAPFSLLDMSPAPIMIVCGIFLAQAFFVWSRRRRELGKPTLMALEVLESPKERAAIFSLFIMGGLGSAITFLIPLYIQIVQGRSGLQTAVAVIPFSLASFAAAVLVIRLYDRLSPRHIARCAFLVVATGVMLLGAVIRNDWGTFMVVVSMAMAGLGEGALMTLLFNVLVTASPKELAGDVGSLRGTTNNLAAGVGTALASALVVGVLSSSVHLELVRNPMIPNELKMQRNLDSVPFISNRQLRTSLASTTATPEQVDEAARINTDARLLALKVSFFALGGLALLAFFPAGGLPGYVRGEVPSAASSEPGRRKPVAVPDR